jgi:hypothetical protein
MARAPGWTVRLARAVMAASALLPVLAGGQVVRGTITDRATGALAAGAVVRLERVGPDSGGAERSVLADPSGAYSIVAWGAGSYRLSVRRIGRLPFLSERLELQDTEVRIVDVQMEPLPSTGLAVATLSTINVRQATPCDPRTANGVKIATLWQDARTALMATEISERDRLVARRLVRYIREIDVPSMDVLSEALKAFDSRDVPGQPQFRSISADSLSRVGYWRPRKGSAIEFHGLDANALLSEAFVRDHCFRLDETPRYGLVGLNFEPIKERTKRNAPAEIQGTIWLDAKSSTLQAVNFRWTKLKGDLRHVGGEVLFARVEDGPWFVSSWRLRMPRELVIDGLFGTTRGSGLVEEGGLVLEDSIDATRTPATIEGQIIDGDRRPMVGAVVRILGTDLRAMTDADGAYQLRGVPPGLQFVVADHDTLAGLGVRVGQSQLLLDDGARREVSFQAPTPGEIVSALCAGQPAPRNTATLRLLLVDSATTRPLAGARIRVAMKDVTRRPAFDTSDETDASGAVVFCGVPTGQPIVVTNVASASQPLIELTMKRGAVIGRVIRTRLSVTY